MQASQQFAAKAPPAWRPIDANMRALSAQGMNQRAGRFCAAIAIDHDAHIHAAARCAAQGFGHMAAHVVLGKQISF